LVKTCIPVSDAYLAAGADSLAMRGNAHGDHYSSVADE
jgi:hypothetical protein